MKKALRILRLLVLVIVVGIAGLLGYVKFFMPNVGAAPEMKVESSPEIIKRGEYLANHVCVCVDCHSKRDWTKYAGPITPGTTGQGGEVFDQQFDFPGSFISQNITPYNLAGWTDGEIYRTITTGVKKDGKAMFPVMPYPLYGKLDPNDVKAIIAYIRTLPSVKKDNPASVPDFPMSIIMNTIPAKAEPQACPAKTDQINYGKYIATAAGCQECHTKQVKGKKVGEPFAGGFEFKMPFGNLLRSANITPDKQTGIGNWTRDMFIKKFKMYADSNYHAPDIMIGQPNTVMPWNMYCGMDTADLGAIFTYLQTVPAVSNTVVRFDKYKMGK
jgi:hypothetical protein